MRWRGCGGVEHAARRSLLSDGRWRTMSKFCLKPNMSKKRSESAWMAPVMASIASLTYARGANRYANLSRETAEADVVMAML